MDMWRYLGYMMSPNDRSASVPQVYSVYNFIHIPVSPALQE